MRRFCFVAIFFVLAIILSAQSSDFLLSWTHGDTIESLRERNKNTNFVLDNDGSVKSYVVTEGHAPTTTTTTFIFQRDGRLGTVIYTKRGAALDVYELVFKKYQVLYGDPTENNEFGINQYHTNLNGFLCFTGDSKFENSNGSVNLIVVASDSNNLPYVLVTESYKY